MTQCVGIATEANRDMDAALVIVKQRMFDENACRGPENLVLVLEQGQPAKQTLRSFRAGESHVVPVWGDMDTFLK